jgi:hypothetical protein
VDATPTISKYPGKCHGGDIISYPDTSRGEGNIGGDYLDEEREMQEGLLCGLQNFID